MPTTTKAQALSTIQHLCAEHHLTPADLAPFLSAGTPQNPYARAIPYIMCVGATLAAIAYSLFLGQIWDLLPAAGHIFASLAGTFLLFGLAISFRGAALPSQLTTWLLILACISLPGSVFLTLTTLGMTGDSLTVALASLVALATYGSLYSFWRTFVAPLAGILIIPIIYFSLLDHFFVGDDLGLACVVLAIIYATLLIPLPDIFPHPHTRSTGLLIANLFVLFGFWDMLENTPLALTLIYPFVIAALTYAGSVFLRERLHLASGFFAATSYLVWVTNEYFADSIGWPLALLILGLLIGAGAYFLLTTLKDTPSTPST